MNTENSIQSIIKAIQYEPLLTATISKKDITNKLILCLGRYFNYALVKNDNIIYIGYTSNLYHRLVQHKTKNFNDILIMEFEDETTARKNEILMIKSLHPQLNHTQR